MVMASFFPVPDSEIDAWLLEDVPYGDLTTAVLGIAHEPGRITYRTRHLTVLSSTEEAARLLVRTGCEVGLTVASGVEVPAGSTFLEATGSAAALHAGWKAALNIRVRVRDRDPDPGDGGRRPRDEPSHSGGGDAQEGTAEGLVDSKTA